MKRVFLELMQVSLSWPTCSPLCGRTKLWPHFLYITRSNIQLWDRICFLIWMPFKNISFLKIWSKLTESVKLDAPILYLIT